MTVFNQDHRCPKCGGGMSYNYNRILDVMERQCGCGYRCSEKPRDAAEEEMRKNLGIKESP